MTFAGSIDCLYHMFSYLVISTDVVCSGGLLTHSFELEGKTKGLFYGAPAVITFRIPTKAALQVWHLQQYSCFSYLHDQFLTFDCCDCLQEAYSTPILPLDVLADRPPEKKFEGVSSKKSSYIQLSDFGNFHQCLLTHIFFFFGFLHGLPSLGATFSQVKVQIILFVLSSVQILKVFVTCKLGLPCASISQSTVSYLIIMVDANTCEHLGNCRI